MIVDPSVLVAIVRDEPDAARFASALAASPRSRMSAAAYLESAVVVDSSRDPVASRRFDELVSTARISIEPFTADHARRAREAYRDFGKGSGHPARLNLGDCFSYALATDAEEPLLFKGEDFARAGVTPVLDGGSETSCR